MPPKPARIDPETFWHLAHLYGSELNRDLALAASRPEAFERIHPDGPDIWAQADYARAEEWALTPDDILRRRTTVSVRGLATLDLAKRLDAGAVV
ncbi:MAG: glycerol-3-phosphate dehydrogenase C-terminal domain-containing protein [Candidatus Dormibacter sp.]